MPQILVLCYHAVSETWDAPLSVTPSDLRRQLRRLLSRGYVGTTFTDAVVTSPHGRTLVVTFDDAFDSVRALAAPVLAELGIPGTVFVATDWVGGRLGWPEVAHWEATEHAGELQAMSWESLRSLHAAGWEIGAHTCSHPRLARLDRQAALTELQRARAICEQQLGAACRSVAYPFGDANADVRAAAAAAGYEAAAGLSSAALVSRDRFEWPRVGVWHGEPDWRFELKVAPAMSRLRGTHWGEALDVARRHVRARAQAARDKMTSRVPAARG